MERTMTAELRDSKGKGVARKIRFAGRGPGVVYGHGDPINVTVDARELYHLLHTEAGVNVLVDLKVDGQSYLAMPREVQRDLLRDRFIHVDFLRIARDEKISVEVPIHVVGESRGVREGGVVEHHLWSLHIECLPQDVPSSVEADISDLGIGDSLKVVDLHVPDGLTIQTSLDDMVVAVVTPQVLRVEAPVAEGEVVEGEAPAAEGEGAPAGGEQAGEPAGQGGQENG